MIKLRWLPTLLLLGCMGAILAFGSEGGHLFSATGIRGYWRDVAHVAAFAILAGIATFCVRGPLLRTGLTAGVFCLAFAFVDEWHQGFIAWRSRSFNDVGFDLVGIVMGVATVSMIRSSRTAKAASFPASDGEAVEASEGESS